MNDKQKKIIELVEKYRKTIKEIEDITREETRYIFERHNEMYKHISKPLDETKFEFTRETCPLTTGDHYNESASLFGPGCWRWHCHFCGECFEE